MSSSLEGRQPPEGAPWRGSRSGSHCAATARGWGSGLRCWSRAPTQDSDLLLRGRLATQAPEIDGQVILNDGSAEPGSFVTCEVTEAHPYDLVARVSGRRRLTVSQRTLGNADEEMGPARSGRPHGHYQISRAPSCAWRGSPRPL